MSDGRKLLRIEYVRLDRVALWDRNPKEHDVGALVESIRRYGFRDAVVYDGALNGGAGGIAAGNGRATALLAMMKDGSEPPAGVDVDASDGMWALPVQFGIDSASQAAAEAFALDHNNLMLSGGSFSAIDASRMYDEAAYVKLLEGLTDEGSQPISVDEDDLRLLVKVIESEMEGAFTPTTSPEFAGEFYSQGNVDQKAREMEKKFVESSQRDQVEVHCPECGATFFVNKKDVLNDY